MSLQHIDRVLTLLGNANADIENAVAEAYAEAGENTVSKIRSGELSNWSDNTGNLRSSIGYVVCRKGQIIKSSDFGTVLNGAEGSEKGRKLSRRLAAEYARYDFALIIVAGEEYAVYVEAIDNNVVLAGGYLYLEKNLVRRMQERISTVLRKYENRR